MLFHVLALGGLIEELKNHRQEAVLVFTNLKKAFDSIIWNKMFLILEGETVNDIRTKIHLV